MEDMAMNRTVQIATEINTIKQQAARQLLGASIQIGERLCEAKELVPHGEWAAWLENNVDYSASTAQNLMRIAREYGSQQMSLSGKTPAEIFSGLSYSQAVALFALPEHEREEFVEQNDVESMSSRELAQAIADKKAADAEVERLTAEVERQREELTEAKRTAKEAASQRTEAEIRARADLKKAESSLLDANRQVKVLEEERDRLNAQVAELTAPAELTPEQVAEFERAAEERAAARMQQLTIDVETARLDREAMEKELEEMRERFLLEANGDLQRFQALFERLQIDLANLADLAHAIGGERGEKLLAVLRNSVNAIM